MNQQPDHELLRAIDRMRSHIEARHRCDHSPYDGAYGIDPHFEDDALLIVSDYLKMLDEISKSLRAPVAGPLEGTVTTLIMTMKEIHDE